MHKEQTTTPRSEFFLGLVVLSLGLFFFWSAQDIPVGGEDEFGARSLPQIVSALIAMFGAIWSGIYFIKWRTSIKPTESRSEKNLLLTKVIPLMILSFVYAFLFQWFGYLVSTFLILFPVLYLYGNRSPVRLLLISSIATTIYYLIFIKALGVFDSGGSVFNLNQLLGL